MTLRVADPDPSDNDILTLAAAEPNWLLCRLELDEKTGKLAKVPVAIDAPGGAPVDRDAAAQHTLQEVIDAIAAHGTTEALRVGYLPREGSAMAAADLDNCQGPNADPVQAQRLAELLALNETYIETSVSGTGARILYARELGIACGIEKNGVGLMETDGKFVTVTFNSLNGDKPVSKAFHTRRKLLDWYGRWVEDAQKARKLAEGIGWSTPSPELLVRFERDCAMTRQLRKAVTGPAIPHKRSEQLYEAAALLLEHGYSREDGASLIMHFNGGAAQHVTDQKDPERALARAFDRNTAEPDSRMNEAKRVRLVAKLGKLMPGAMPPQPEPEPEPEPEINLDLLEACRLTADMMPKRSIARLMGGVFARRYLTVLAASGGASKSTIAAGLCISIAAGLASLHVTPERAVVVYVSLEDDQDMLDAKLCAVREEFPVQFGEAAKGKLYGIGDDTFRKMTGLEDLSLLTLGKDKVLLVRKEIIAAIERLIDATGAHILIIDPLAVLYGGVQMSPEATNLVARNLARIARDKDIAMGALSHIRKPASGSHRASQHDVKHGSELVDTARVVVNLRDVPASTRRIWSEATGEHPETFDDVREFFISKTNIGPGGIAFHYRVGIKLVKCKDGKLESAPVALPFNAPTSNDLETRRQANHLRLFAHMRPIFGTETVRPRNSEAAAEMQHLVFADVLAEAEIAVGVGAIYSPGRVLEQWKDDGWVAVENRRDQTGVSDRKWSAIVVGPTPPESEA